MSEEIQDISKELKSLLTEHSYYKRYEESSVVTHTTGDSINFYKATKNVPRYISINNKSYWKKLNKKTDDGETPEPTSDNDFIPIYFPPELLGEQIPMYHVQSYDNFFVMSVMAYYIIPNQITQPEITGVKINNVSYTLVSLEDDEPVPGIAVVGDIQVIPTDEEVYQELQYMKEMGMDINANIGDGLLIVRIGAFSNTAVSGPITFELNTNSGNCTIVIPEYVEPQPIAYIYVSYDSNYSISFTSAYDYNYSDQYYYAEYLESDIGSKTTIRVYGNDIACTSWQESSDGETWTDIPDSASKELTVTIKEGNTYYRPIVVSTEPDLVEISREEDTTFSTTCATDNEGFNTGMRSIRYTVTYEDQNSNSDTYLEHYTSTIYDSVEDLVSCSIPTINNTSVYVNVYTEYDDDGTILINDTTKAAITTYVHRTYIKSNDTLVSLPFSGTIKTTTSDTDFYVIGDIVCAPGYSAKKILYRTSSSGEWDTLSVSSYNSFDENSNAYIYSYHFSPLISLSDAYLDVKIILGSGTYREVHGHIYTEYNYNNTQYTVEDTKDITLSTSPINETEQSVSYSEKYYHGNLGNGIVPYFQFDDEKTILEFYINNNQTDLYKAYEVYEQYVRYSKNDTWTPISICNSMVLDLLHDYVDVKFVLKPISCKVTINILKEETINGETIQTIDNTLGTISASTISIDGGTANNISISLGTPFVINQSIDNYINVTYDTIFNINTTPPIVATEKIEQYCYTNPNCFKNTGTGTITIYHTSDSIETSHGFIINCYSNVVSVHWFPQPLEFVVSVIVPIS